MRLSDRKAVAALQLLGLLAAGYLFIASTVYAFRHPEKTSTQRLIEIKEALLFH